MARYYGTLSGSGKAKATKSGTRNTGICASVQSYEVSLSVWMHDNPNDDRDHLIDISYQMDDSTSSPSTELFRGTVSELIERLREGE